VINHPSQNPVKVFVNETLAKMKRGLAEDPFAWIVPVAKMAFVTANQ